MKSNFYKVFSILLAVLLTVVSVPVAALAATPIYTYECSATAPAKELVTHLEHNDAIDSWNLSDTQNRPNGQQIAMKTELGRTHMVFAFSVEAAGTYYLAIKYYSYPDSDSTQRRICLQIDDLGKEDITPTRSASTNTNDTLYLIVPMTLTAGDHTFGVYIPLEYGQTINGSFVNSANLICYDIYSDVDAEPAPEPEPEPTPTVPGGDLKTGIYTNYQCVSALPDLSGTTVVMDAFNNDAIDSFNQTYVKGLTDGTALSLKLDFASGPRTHLTFGFNAPEAGTYKIAIEYNAPTNNNLHRIIHVQVDSMGKQQFSPLTNAVDGPNQYLILTLPLQAGDHTLSVYASADNGNSDGNGKLYAPTLVYSYHAWKATDSELEPDDPTPSLPDGDEADGKLALKPGAAVSMTENPCLRFTAGFSKSYYDQLVSEEGAENLSFGMIMVQASYVYTMSPITFGSLDQARIPYTVYESTLRQAEDGSYYFYGVTAVERTDTPYAAIAFIQIRSGEEASYIYSEFSIKNTRSVEIVAEYALADVKSAADGAYSNAVTDHDGATVYTIYDPKAYNALKVICPKKNL